MSNQWEPIFGKLSTDNMTRETCTSFFQIYFLENSCLRRDEPLSWGLRHILFHPPPDSQRGVGVGPFNKIEEEVQTERERERVSVLLETVSV